jgi:hypothetical protein
MIGFIFIIFMECVVKKTFLCITFIVGINAISFSQEETKGFPFDIWFSTGPAFGNYFMNGNDLESSYTGSPGINLNFYALFGERNIGVFFNYGILFPAVNNTEKNYDPSVQLDFILAGIGFGHNINNNIKLYFGIGPNINMLFLHSGENDEKNGDYLIGLGIGGNIGFKYKLAKWLSIDVGTTVSYNFAAYRELRDDIDFRRNRYDLEKSGWVDRYSMTGIKPYIAIGFGYSN